MLVTLSGIDTEVSLWQLEKVELFIPVTPSGIIIEEISEQLSKAPSPMLLTVLGILTDVSFPHLKKVFIPILSTPSGISTEIRELQFRKV